VIASRRLGPTASRSGVSVLTFIGIVAGHAITDRVPDLENTESQSDNPSGDAVTHLLNCKKRQRNDCVRPRPD